MPKPEKAAHGLRSLVWIYGGLVLLGVTYATASTMLNQPRASVGFRAAGVIVGAIGFVLWLLATAKIILMRDEFTRRIHLTALALAFAVTVLCVFTGDLLQRAGFIHSILLNAIWLEMFVVWCAALIGAGWYYRR
jgi:hypothetical protein